MTKSEVSFTVNQVILNTNLHCQSSCEFILPLKHLHLITALGEDTLSTTYINAFSKFGLWSQGVESVLWPEELVLLKQHLLKVLGFNPCLEGPSFCHMTSQRSQPQSKRCTWGQILVSILDDVADSWSWSSGTRRWLWASVQGRFEVWSEFIFLSDQERTKTCLGSEPTSCFHEKVPPGCCDMNCFYMNLWFLTYGGPHVSTWDSVGSNSAKQRTLFDPFST